MRPIADPGSRGAGIACLLVTAIGWGLNWPAMKQLMLELPPLFARGVAGLDGVEKDADGAGVDAEAGAGL